MGDTPPAANVLTDRLLRSWLRCRRKAWLDHRGNPNDRQWTAHRNLQLDDQQRSFVALLPERPGHGEDACRAGAPGVIGLRLKGFGPGGEVLESHPPLLLRVRGHSRWGDFAYQPVVARQGRRLTREHQIPLAFIAHVLAQVQQASVPDMLVVGGGGRRLERQRVGFSAGLKRQLAEALRKLGSDLERSQPPALAADRRKCALCCWRGVCSAEAAKAGHLSEVSGIGAKRREMLLELGIEGLQDLAAADPEQLALRMERFGEQHGEVAHSLVAQAMVQRDGRVQRLDSELALPELVDAPGVLLYDIESDPDARHDFLHGFVRLPRRDDGQWDLAASRYHPLFVLQQHSERSCWRRLKTLLDRYPHWPVLHYGETEALALRRMAQRQGLSTAQQTKLRQRLIDIHARIRRHWRLPLNSYGLKTVAAWRGFHWSQNGADGAKALLWWRQWQGNGLKQRGRDQVLRWIFAYNRDDCLATWAVAAWLLEQDSLLNQNSLID
ncbi:MAG: nuclease [Cyanobium sp. NAT70]|nr:nuclease [Cyanobium sp. NAT70]|tara:strand:+ start:488 stop:1978 length:1491 start_codon:yes stop_codon:yes gene_type:complete